MTNKKEEALELALIATIEEELLVMHSFCISSLPCDVATAVAMRMSRSVVSSICRLGNPNPDTGRVVISKATQTFLLEVLGRVEQLNRQFELRLQKLPNDAPEWTIWSV